MQGVGVLNAVPGYHFRVWVSDGAPDSIRVRIWNADGVVYDNGSLTKLGGGSIQVH